MRLSPYSIPLFVFVCLLCLLPVGNRHTTNPHEPRVYEPATDRAESEWRQAPAGLREAFEQARYRVELEEETAHGGGAVVLAHNPAQKFRARFDASGLSVEPRETSAAGAWRFGMRLEAYGYGGRLREAAWAAPVAEGNRVEYRRGDLIEWYVNERRGVEQGFTLREPPESGGGAGHPLELRLRVEGDLRAEANGDGTGVVFNDSDGARALVYDQLASFDARGRQLPSRMRVEGGGLVLEVNDAGAHYPLTVDPFIQQQRLQASDTAAGDQFGASVAVSGNTAIVGSPQDDHGTVSNPGAAYIFTRSGEVWTEQQRIQASDAAANDQFGNAVAISGDTVIVGAWQDVNTSGSTSGSAYIFTRSGTTWTQQQRLQASDAAAFDQFAISVSLSGDTAIVGASQDDNSGGSNAGSAYVFTRSGTTWTQQQRLQALDAAAGDAFGFSVSLSGETALVGARFDDNSGGTDASSAYVFTRSGTTWTQQQRLQASDAAANDLFGFSVSLSGDTALIGATGDNLGAGAAYVFTRSGTTWTQQQKLVASDAAANDAFGGSVALSGRTALVGARGDNNSGGTDAGSVYVFTRTAGVWSEQERLQASDAAASDAFGGSVALGSGTAIVGAAFDDLTVGSNAGSAYVFYRPETDMEVNKRDTQDPVPVGDSFDYELRVYNRGTLEAHNVTVTDTVPAGLTVTGVSLHASSDYTGAGCTINANTVNCSFGTMRVFDNTFDGPIKKGKVLVIITVTAAQTGQYTNAAVVTADEHDPVEENSTGRQPTSVLGVSSVEITPNNVPGGAACQKPLVKVTLTGVAPFDTFVSLSDDLAATTNIPGSASPLLFRIPEGQSSATLAVDTVQVGSEQTGTVTASFGTSANAALTVRPIGVKSLSVSPATVVGGAQVSGTVKIECTPDAQGVSVTLKTGKAAVAKFIDPQTSAEVHPLVLLLTTNQAAFTIQTYTVAADTAVNVSAAAGGVTHNERLDVTPP